MRQLGAVEPNLKPVHAIVYAISNENAADLRKMKDAEKLGDTYVFPSDKDGKAAAKYSGGYENSPVLKPATFVIGRQRKTVYAYVDAENYWVRAAADSAVAAVRSVGRETRR